MGLRTEAALLRGSGLRSPDRALEHLRALPGGIEDWARVLSTVADPDLTALQLLRLHEAAPHLLASVIDEGGRRLERLVAVMGASRWAGDHLIAEPARLEGIWVEPASPREELLGAIGADPTSARPVAAEGRSADDMRRAYRRVLLDVLADDVTSPDPTAHMPTVGRRMADLADAALEASLALARRDIDPDGRVRLAVIAMGKTGARELNYISDVDVVHVVEAAEEGMEEREVVEIGTRLAVMTAHGCAGAGAEPPLWTVDANLRPEGRDGALVRTLASYRAYWEKWAQTWEFQALLKARHAAGDAELGAAFEAAAAPFVWSAAGREGFVEQARAMRTRVEENIPRREAERDLKLGRGGLRDVEFTVQLLQLVHGRTDESLHVRDTVSAIEVLRDGGYIGRAHAAELQRCYCWLRAVEHRAQMPRMRRTHLVPASEDELRVMARAMRLEGAADATAFLGELAQVRSRVRALHEDVFYRPIVAATAQLSADEASLDRDSAIARLAAIGYRDPAGALAHIEALTRGTSRRATIQRNLLPVFISWLADGADPDMGLLSFRSLSERIGESHWYLALLRDSGVAARRLCTLLPTSRWVGEALSTRPEAVEWLDDDDLLTEVAPERLRRELTALVGRHPDAEGAAERVRAVRSRELTRAALADCLGGVDANRPAIAHAADAALSGALAVAEREEAEASGVRAEVAFIAMGRFGGAESSYASDADVIAVHRSVGAVTEAEAAEAATRIVNRTKALLGATTSQMSLAMDLDLRPEGRSGPMSRTVASYVDYWTRWASAWERQALLRARGVAGPSDLLDEFFTALDPIRWGSAPTAEQVRDIRLLKARMENERLPRGTDPMRHVKLGPGGLSDVEWVVQLLQMRHASDHPELRSTSTLEALEACRRLGLLDDEQADCLRGAWELASRVRAGNVLTTGRMSGPKLDVLPLGRHELVPLARLLGFAHGQEALLEEAWLRAARRARAVMDEVFWQ